MQFASLLFALPAGVSAYYANTTTASVAVTASPVPPAPLAVVDPVPSSSQDVTTYVTVELGKTLTITTPVAQITPAPANPPSPGLASSSQDLTTYVTVVLGRTLTLTTAKAAATGIGLAANGGNVIGTGAGAAAALAAGALYLL